MRPEAGYVSPLRLLPYRAFPWSRWHSRDGPEAWDRMCADVAENGFTTAALLHYNHRTGAAYLAEGNHRVGIATELGIPVPLVVYRTTKTAPDYPMRALTEPGEFSMRDAEGFSRFPQEASPALIGLPLLNPRARIDIEAVERMAAAREEDRTPALAPERAAESGFEM